MSKFAEPWFRPSRGVWYVTLDGKQINLGPDRVKAFAEYARLIAKSPGKQRVAPRSIPALFDEFMDFVQKSRSAATYTWFQYRLQRFANAFPDLSVADLKSHHVEQWALGYNLSRTSVRNYMRAVKAAISWAFDRGYIETNPIARMKLPMADRKEVVFSQEDFEELLTAVRNDQLRDLLIVTWETGCRPQESLRVEARHVDLVNQRWAFPKSESKNKRTVRVVYMTDTAMQIVRRLVEQNPTGRLFRNTNGNPWHTYAVNNCFARIKERLGKKYSLYALRHAWATNALLRGVDPLTVAVLMGHSDPSMLSKVYQHLSLNPAHMLSQAKRAMGRTDIASGSTEPPATTV